MARRFAIPALGVVVSLLWAAGTAQAAPRTLTVETRDYYVARIGPFRPARDPRLSAAIRALGRPSRRTLEGGTCRVLWARLRLRIDFENFGGSEPGQTTCTPSVGRAQAFIARGRRVRTIRGLRVGQPSASIPERHPDAEFRDGAWAVVLAVFPFGVDDEPSPVLSAIPRAGRVAALTGYIGGAGE
jgi:hypothetical protein